MATFEHSSVVLSSYPGSSDLRRPVLFRAALRLALLQHWVRRFGPYLASVVLVMYGATGMAQSPASPKPAETASVEEGSVDSATDEMAQGMDVRPLYERRREARQLALSGFRHLREGNAELAHQELKTAVGQWPNHFQVVYGLAQCEVALGREEQALQRVLGLIRRGYSAPLATDPVFGKLSEHDLFRLAIQELDALKTRQVGKSEAVFQLAERDLIPEAVVFDEATQSYYVSSVHRRKILRRDRQGKVSEFASERLWAVSGLAIDHRARILWAATSALPNMRDYTPEDEGKTALVAFDLDSEREVFRFENREPGHRLADLTVDAQGRVYVSDGTLGVWRTVTSQEMAPSNDGQPTEKDVWSRQVAPPSQAVPSRAQPSQETTEARQDSVWKAPAGLEMTSPAGFFRSPQGLATSVDGRYLFAADYSYGIAVLELASGEWFYLEEPSGVVLLGVDGLNVMQGDLVAIQNGTRPQRILRLRPDLAQRQMVQSEVLAMNLSQWSEPTLGTVVGRDFVYVGNSQWDRFDAESKLPPLDELAEPTILRLTVEADFQNEVEQ